MKGGMEAECVVAKKAVHWACLVDWVGMLPASALTYFWLCETADMEKPSKYTHTLSGPEAHVIVLVPAFQIY